MVQLLEYLGFFVLAAWRLLTLHLRRRYGVVQVHNLPDFLVFVALIPKLMGARVILDIHDLMPEFFASKTESDMQSSLVRLLILQEQLSCRFAHQVITVTSEWRETLIRRGVPAVKVAVVMNVADGDSLGWAKLTTGEDQIMLATAAGQAIRFEESEVRPMGLPAAGVMGIKLADEADGLIGMDVVQPEGYLWSITDNALAKATAMTEYPTQGRYGQGVINMRLPKEAAEVVAAVIVPEKSEVLVLTAHGSTKRVTLDKTAVGSRAIKPKELFKVGMNNRVTGALTTMERPEVEENEEETTVAALHILRFYTFCRHRNRTPLFDGEQEGDHHYQLDAGGDAVTKTPTEITSENGRHHQRP